MTQQQRDGLQRFAMYGLAVRGAFVSLDETWQAIRLRNLARHRQNNYWVKPWRPPH